MLLCFWWLQAVVVPVLLPGGVLAGVQWPGLPLGALGGVGPVLFPYLKTVGRC